MYSLYSMKIELERILLQVDPYQDLLELILSERGRNLLPEINNLDMDQGGQRLHKDTLLHSVRVCSQAPPRLRVRWAALLHDIGKPDTRRIDGTTVTFRHHEEVGRQITIRLLTKLQLDPEAIAGISDLVALSGRTHADDSWTDSAVRRLITDAGPLLDDLLDLTSADCTSGRPGRRQEVISLVESLRERAKIIQHQDAVKAIRPALNGEQIMEILDVPPGRIVGAGYKYLLEYATQGQMLSEAQAKRLLIDWYGLQTI